MPIKSGSLSPGGTLLANQEVKAYECVAPASAAGFTVTLCNKTGSEVKVRISVGPGADSNAPGTRFLNYDSVVQPNEPLDRTRMACSVGDKVFVSSNTTGVDYAVYGFEKP